METIITQVAEKVVEDILKNIYENGISDIGKTAESLMTVLKEGALEILSAAVTETDKAVLAAKKERKIDGITVKQRNVPRTVVTSLGNLTFRRTYFTLLTVRWHTLPISLLALSHLKELQGSFVLSLCRTQHLCQCKDQLM